MVRGGGFPGSQSPSFADIFDQSEQDGSSALDTHTETSLLTSLRKSVQHPDGTGGDVSHFQRRRQTFFDLSTTQAGSADRASQVKRGARPLESVRCQRSVTGVIRTKYRGRLDDLASQISGDTFTFTTNHSPPQSPSHTRASSRGSLTSRASVFTKYSLPAETDVDELLMNVWSIFDRGGKAFLTYEEVDDLLFFLGVDFDTCVEIEFYHAVDRSHEGKVVYNSFVRAFNKFRREKKVVTAPLLGVMCALASHTGLTAEAASEVWRGHVSSRGELAESHEPETVMRILNNLQIPATAENTMELIASFDCESKKLAYHDFIGLFTNCLITEEELRRREWLEGVHHLVGRRDRAAVFQSQEQLRIDEAKELVKWHRTRFLWVFFAYAQLQILVPIFLMCFKDPFLDFHAPDAFELATRVGLLATDVVIFWHVGLGFILPKEHMGAPVYKRLHIRSIYVKSFQFVLDVVAAMPLDLIAVFFCQGCFLHPVFRLNKLVLVLNMHNMFQQLLSGVFGPRWWRVANALYWWATLGHIVACLFHSIITTVGDSEAFVVLTVEGYSNLPLAHQYMQSLSFAINTMAGLSRGRFPQNDMLSAFALCVVVVGVFVYALLLAVVAAGLTMHGQEGKFNEFIDELKSIFSPEVRANRLPKSFVKEILDYHSHVFHSTGQLTLADDILQDLPQEMRVGIDLVLGRETIGRVSLLESVQTDELVYALQQCLSLVVYPPGWDVIETGEEGSDMYFISSGTCAVLGSDGEPVYDLKRGDVFGEISLLTSVLRTATIRTLTYVNLLVISSSDFYMVAAAFPGLLEKVQDKARSRIRTIRDGQSATATPQTEESVDIGDQDDEDLLDWIKRQHTSNDRPRRMSARTPRESSRNHP